VVVAVVGVEQRYEGACVDGDQLALPSSLLMISSWRSDRALRPERIAPIQDGNALAFGLVGVWEVSTWAATPSAEAPCSAAD
jgi:hypothetical protein